MELIRQQLRESGLSDAQIAKTSLANAQLRAVPVLDVDAAPETGGTSADHTTVVVEDETPAHVQVQSASSRDFRHRMADDTMHATPALMAFQRPEDRFPPVKRETPAEFSSRAAADPAAAPATAAEPPAPPASGGTGEAWTDDSTAVVSCGGRSAPVNVGMQGAPTTPSFDDGASVAVNPATPHPRDDWDLSDDDYWGNWNSQAAARGRPLDAPTQSGRASTGSTQARGSRGSSGASHQSSWTFPGRDSGWGDSEHTSWGKTRPAESDAHGSHGKKKKKRKERGMAPAPEEAEPILPRQDYVGWTADEIRERIALGPRGGAIPEPDHHPPSETTTDFTEGPSEVIDLTNEDDLPIHDEPPIADLINRGALFQIKREGSPAAPQSGDAYDWGSDDESFETLQTARADGISLARTAEASADFVDKYGVDAYLERVARKKWNVWGAKPMMRPGELLRARGLYPPSLTFLHRSILQWLKSLWPVRRWDDTQPATIISPGPSFIQLNLLGAEIQTGAVGTVARASGSEDAWTEMRRPRAGWGVTTPNLDAPEWADVNWRRIFVGIAPGAASKWLNCGPEACMNERDIQRMHKSTPAWVPEPIWYGSANFWVAATYPCSFVVAGELAGERVALGDCPSIKVVLEFAVAETWPKGHPREWRSPRRVDIKAKGRRQEGFPLGCGLIKQVHIFIMDKCVTDPTIPGLLSDLHNPDSLPSSEAYRQAEGLVGGRTEWNTFLRKVGDGDEGSSLLPFGRWREWAEWEVCPPQPTGPFADRCGGKSTEAHRAKGQEPARARSQSQRRTDGDVAGGRGARSTRAHSTDPPTRRLRSRSSPRPAAGRGRSGSDTYYKDFKDVRPARARRVDDNRITEGRLPPAHQRAGSAFPSAEPSLIAIPAANDVPMPGADSAGGTDSPPPDRAGVPDSSEGGGSVTVSDREKITTVRIAWGQLRTMAEAAGVTWIPATCKADATLSPFLSAEEVASRLQDMTRSFIPSISDSGRSCPVCGIRDARTMLYGRWRRLIVPSARRSQIASAAVSTFPGCAGMTQHLNRLHLPIPAPGAVPSLRTGHCRARSPRCHLAPPPSCWPLCIGHQAWRWRMFMPLARKSPGD